MAYYDDERYGGRHSAAWDDRDGYGGRSSYDSYGGGRSARDGYGWDDYGVPARRNNRPEYQPSFESDFGEDFSYPASTKKKSIFGKGGFFSSQKSNAGNVIIYTPRSFDEVEKIIDCLKRQEQVIVDFAGLAPDSAEKVLNILSGAIYALSGSMKRLKDTMFLFTPSGVSISVGAVGDGRR